MDLLVGRHLRCVLIAAGVLLALASSALAHPAICAAGSASPSPSRTVLRIGWTAEPDNLNPFIGWSQPSYELWSISYDFLFGTGPDGKPVLCLASQFPTQANGGLSPDGRVWTIHLKSGLRWQDGQPLTARDVAFSFNYALSMAYSPLAVAVAGVVRAKALDDTSVRIECSRPKADMTNLNFPIVPEHIWKKVDPEKASTSYSVHMPIVGSGPFQIVSWDRGRDIRLVRNPYYWGKRPAVDEIIFEMYQNADTMVADLRAGTIDAAWGIPTGQFSALKTAPGIETVAYNYLNWEYLNCNCNASPASKGNPVLRDQRFRNALNYALDREKIDAIAFDGYAQPGTTIITPDSWKDPDYHWQPPTDQLYSFDLAKANGLLDAAGYARGADGLRLYKGKPITLRLWATTNYPAAQVEGKLIAGWLKQLGLKIDLSVIDYDALIAGLFNYEGDTYAPDFDLYIYDWDGYVDPGQTLSTLATDQIGSTNEPSWSYPQYDRLNEEQAAALDPAKRQRLIWGMQRVMYEQSPWLVLAYPQHLEAYNTDKWTGWTRIMGGKGPAFYAATPGDIATYLDLRPIADDQPASTSPWATAIPAILAVLAIVVAVLLVSRQRRHRRAEESL